MRIVVDVTPLSLPRTGIGNYVRGMVAGLTEAAGDAHEVVGFAVTGYRGRREIEASLEGLPIARRIFALPLGRAWRAAWNRLRVPHAERVVGSLDVFHFSEWVYVPQRRGVRATTMHDLVPLRFPDLVHPRTLRMHAAKVRYAAASCDVIVANSRFTAADVAERLSFPPDRIQVAHPGIDPVFRPTGPRARLERPYILGVSTLEPRKNLGGLVRAFELLRRRRDDLDLVLAGGLRPGGRPPQLAEGVRLLGYVEDEELASLYRGASAFVYPSLFEGFGLPIVEALASGTPTVASAHPSLDEASGTAALRGDPQDSEALAEAIEAALAADPDRRAEGLRHAAQFTWRANGESVLHGYQTAL
jgi:glycosyltransferase involved in cell wall biosynthesis